MFSFVSELLLLCLDFFFLTPKFPTCSFRTAVTGCPALSPWTHRWSPCCQTVPVSLQVLCSDAASLFQRASLFFFFWRHFNPSRAKYGSKHTAGAILCSPLLSVGFKFSCLLLAHYFPSSLFSLVLSDIGSRRGRKIIAVMKTGKFITDLWIHF